MDGFGCGEWRRWAASTGVWGREGTGIFEFAALFDSIVCESEAGCGKKVKDEIKGGRRKV